MFEFITRRSFLFNLAAAIVAVLLMAFLFLQSLNFLTHHGDYVNVPDVNGKSAEAAIEMLEKAGFEVEVQDSVYYDSLPKLSVVRQIPAPGETVKVNRTIYLTINRAMAPLVTMPNFIGQPFRSVELQLKSLGLKLQDTLYKPDFAVNSVLEQQYEGVPIRPGTTLPMGAGITLVLGGGIQPVDLPVPQLLGLTFEEAKLLLESQGILLGAIVADANVRDSASAYIYRQNPNTRTEDGAPVRIRPGQLMDIYLSVEKPVIDTSLQNQLLY